MSTSDRVMKTILQTVEEFNEEHPEDERIQSVDGVLFGDAGQVDSVGLMNLIVATEEAIEDEFGTPVTLADEQAMAEDANPFETVASLAAYVAKRLEEAGGG